MARVGDGGHHRDGRLGDFDEPLDKICFCQAMGRVVSGNLRRPRHGRGHNPDCAAKGIRLLWATVAFCPRDWRRHLCADTVGIYLSTDRGALCLHAEPVAAKAVGGKLDASKNLANSLPF
jgi:hypothetical protein